MFSLWNHQTCVYESLTLDNGKDNGFCTVVLSTHGKNQLGDKVKNAEVLTEIAVKEAQVCRNIPIRKIASAEGVL